MSIKGEIMAKKKLFLLIKIIAFVALSLFSKGIYAQEDDIYVMTLPIAKQLIEEEMASSFTEQLYNPPFEIHLISDQASGSKATPEDAFVSGLSAVLNGNLNWWLDTMAEADRRDFAMKTADEQMNEFTLVTTQAAALFKGNNIRLLKKIAMKESSVIIDYSVYNGASNDFIISLSTPFILEENMWKMCLTCGSNPTDSLSLLFENKNYDFDGNENRITINKIYTKKPEAPFFQFISN